MRAIVAIRAHPLGTDGKYLLAAALVALAVQQIAVHVIPVSDVSTAIRPVIFVVTTAVVVFVAFSLRMLVGAWLVAAGILLNCIPIVAHGGTMPVAWETVSASGSFPEITDELLGEQIPGSKDVLLLRKDIHFEPLSDRYFVDPPVYRSNIYSLGDFAIFAGIAVAIIELASFVISGRLPATLWRGRSLLAVI
jgi:hypothetical protein